MASPIFTSHPVPWHARPSMLRAAVILLGLAVLAEGGLILWAERRLDRVVMRVEGLHILADLGLGTRPGKLLVVAAEDELRILHDLRAVQAQAEAWLQNFAAQQDLEPEVSELLAGVVSATVAAWGDYRILRAVDGLSARDTGGFAADIERRCFRAVDLVLAPEQAQAFRAGFTPAWERWTATATAP
ncbi:MAG: hypothetical protein ABIO70_30155 [Pseudomonadota bacterium]